MLTPPSPDEKRTWLCLNESELAGYVDGVLSGWRRRRAETHLAGCIRCRRELSLLIHSEQLPSDSAPAEWIARVRQLSQKRTPVAHRRWQWAMAGAALSCGLAVSAWLVIRPAHPSPALAKIEAPGPMPSRSQSGDAAEVRTFGNATAEPAVIAPAAGATVGREPELRWQPVPSALSYEIAILNRDGDTVWRTRTDAESLRVPADAALTHGAEYFVMISANLSSGKTVRAKAVPFRVER